MTCAIPGCPAIAVAGSANCSVHAKHRKWMEATSMLRCVACKKPIRKGEFYTERPQGTVHSRTACYLKDLSTPAAGEPA